MDNGKKVTLRELFDNPPERKKPEIDPYQLQREWVEKEWKETSTGNYYLWADGVAVTVFYKEEFDQWKWVINGEWSEKMFNSPADAMVDSFNKWIQEAHGYAL
jgi:hypothetical protein